MTNTFNLILHVGTDKPEDINLWIEADGKIADFVAPTTLKFTCWIQCQLTEVPHETILDYVAKAFRKCLPDDRGIGFSFNFHAPDGYEYSQYITNEILKRIRRT